VSHLEGGIGVLVVGLDQSVNCEKFGLADQLFSWCVLFSMGRLNKSIEDTAQSGSQITHGPKIISSQMYKTNLEALPLGGVGSLQVAVDRRRGHQESGGEECRDNQELHLARWS